MKLAYVTPYPSADVHAWSGLVYFIREALRQAGCEIAPVDDLKESGRYRGKAKEILYRKLTGKTYLRDRAPGLLDAYARQVSTRCKALAPDVIFSPGTIPISHLKTRTPVVFWTDATLAGLTDYYAHFTNLCAETLRDGQAMEQRALSNCSLAIYSSEWAARTAIEHYDVDPAKVKVVPYGANITQSRSEAEVRAMIDARSPEICRLLLVGVDWERKGAAIAVEAAEELHRRGIRTELHIVGCHPPGPVPEFVKIHGFVSKKTPEGFALLERLFSESHFLIVPSRAECFGLVYAEASSFGLPSLAADTGGVPDAVRSGKNGQLFPLEARGAAYADFIAPLLASIGDYRRLALQSLEEFQTRLNWDVAGTRVMELMQGLPF